jgi:hypothetical protein
MRIFRPLLMLLILVVAVWFCGVQGQYNMPSVSAPISYAPISYISAPEQTAILGKAPATIHLATQQQSVPNSQYQAVANNIGPSLWIQDSGIRTQHVVIPQGATVTLIAVSPAVGSGYLSEMLNGTAYNSNFYFYRNSQLTFCSDAIGQHVLSFTINGQSSNQVTINVIAYVPLQYYLTPYSSPAPYNYPVPNYLQNYYYLRSYYGSELHYPCYEYGRHWPWFYGRYDWL